MKKIIIFILLLIPIKVNASYIVMDADSSRVLEGSNIHEKRLIASTSKIMTCIVALENSNINQEIEVDDEVLKAYGSAIYIEKGEHIKLIDLLYGLMLRSGNDAAVEIASHVSSSIDEFVKLMNNKAKELNMKDTLFINPSGLEDSKVNGNISTPYDMALLMSYALNNDLFKEIISTKKYITKTDYKTYLWINKNKLLHDYKYCIGGKTGYTKKARRTLATASTKDNKTIIIVTLNDPNDFKNHKIYYENNFKKYNLVNILSKDNFKVDNYNNLYIKDNFNMLLTKKEENKISIDYKITRVDNYNNDEQVGKAIIKLGNNIIKEIPIYIKINKINNKSIISKILDFIVFWR